MLFPRHRFSAPFEPREQHAVRQKFWTVRREILATLCDTKVNVGALKNSIKKHLFLLIFHDKLLIHAVILFLRKVETILHKRCRLILQSHSYTMESTSAQNNNDSWNPESRPRAFTCPDQYIRPHGSISSGEQSTAPGAAASEAEAVFVTSPSAVVAQQLESRLNVAEPEVDSCYNSAEILADNSVQQMVQQIAPNKSIQNVAQIAPNCSNLSVVQVPPSDAIQKLTPVIPNGSSQNMFQVAPGGSIQNTTQIVPSDSGQGLALIVPNGSSQNLVHPGAPVQDLAKIMSNSSGQNVQVTPSGSIQNTTQIMPSGSNQGFANDSSQNVIQSGALAQIVPNGSSQNVLQVTPNGSTQVQIVSGGSSQEVALIVPNDSSQNVVQPGTLTQNLAQIMPSGSGHNIVQVTPDGSIQNTTQIVSNGSSQGVALIVPNDPNQNMVQVAPAGPIQNTARIMPNGFNQNVVQVAQDGPIQNVAETVSSGSNQNVAQVAPSAPVQNVAQIVPRNSTWDAAQFASGGPTQTVTRIMPNISSQDVMQTPLDAASQKMMKFCPQRSCQDLMQIKPGNDTFHRPTSVRSRSNSIPDSGQTKVFLRTVSSLNQQPNVANQTQLLPVAMQPPPLPVASSTSNTRATAARTACCLPSTPDVKLRRGASRVRAVQGLAKASSDSSSGPLAQPGNVGSMQNLTPVDSKLASFFESSVQSSNSDSTYSLAQLTPVDLRVLSTESLPANHSDYSNSADDFQIPRAGTYPETNLRPYRHPTAVPAQQVTDPQRAAGTSGAPVVPAQNLTVTRYAPASATRSIKIVDGDYTRITDKTVAQNGLWFCGCPEFKCGVCNEK
ncbi:unnamed protein product [Gongylonema pulchrum]|uniref:Transcription factor Sp3 n=1 Tax=Gongylonema pulchrum TaxID=637853 RepID=A0A183DYK4_9BILA|nr:unnamed protein product [Gongylonema pulchrum]